jgi:hypothetical protein
MRLLPPSTIPQRVVCLSVAVPDKKAAGTAVWKRAIQRYVGLFDEFGIPATWGITDLASTNADQFAAASHELALCGDATWIQAEHGRKVMRSHLQRQLSAATSNRLDIRTLIMRDTMVSTDFEVLVRAGISMVASDQSAAGGRRANHPIQTLRFGLWEMQASLLVPERAGMISGFSMRRRIDRIISAGGVCHVALTVSADADRPTLRTLEGLLRHVARRRDDADLEVLSFSQIAAQLPSRRSSQSAHSILRADDAVARAA